mgnify:CR=1 FL=1
MAKNEQSLKMRIEEGLTDFCDRMAARVKRNHELLGKMRAEEDLRKVFIYFKAFFSSCDLEEIEGEVGEDIYG